MTHPLLPTRGAVLTALAVACGALPAFAAETGKTRVIFKFETVGGQIFKAAFRSVDVSCQGGDKPDRVELAIEPGDFRKIETEPVPAERGAKQAFGMEGQVTQVLQTFRDFKLVITADAATLQNKKGQELAPVEVDDSPRLGPARVALEGQISRNEAGLGLGFEERRDDPNSLRDAVAIEIQVDCG